MKRLGISELHRLRRIGREFTLAAKLPGEFCESHFEEVWAGLIETGLGIIFYEESEDGSIAGVLGATFIPDMFSGRRMAAEAFWFLVPEARGRSLSIRLLNAFEEEAKARKCEQILMVSLSALEVGLIYIRRGYSALETVYSKEI